MPSETKCRYTYPDGSEVPSGYCVLPDHHVTTVLVTFRSLRPVGPEAIRDLIQQRHEVVGLEVTDRVCVVRNGQHAPLAADVVETKA